MKIFIGLIGTTLAFSCVDRGKCIPRGSSIPEQISYRVESGPDLLTATGRAELENEMVTITYESGGEIIQIKYIVIKKYGHWLDTYFPL